MKLLALRIHQFKGIQDFELTPKGNNVMVFGANATGKTTLADAFWWLLFDKDSTGRKAFLIKPVTEKGTIVPDQTPTVEATVTDPEGQSIALRKELHEKWTRKRGKAKPVFEGHETSYFVNETPISKAEYDTYVKNMIDPDVFRLMTNVRYFNEILGWKERREVLLKLAPEVSDEEVMATDPSLGDLGPGIEAQHKKALADLKTVRHSLDALPPRIDEARRTAERWTMDPIVQVEIAPLRQQRDAKLQELAQVKAGGGAAEKTKELRQVEAEMMEFETKTKAMTAKRVADQQAKITAIEADIDRLLNEITHNEQNITHEKDLVSRYATQLETLGSQWQEWREKVFDPEAGQVCPACGQAIPVADLEKAFNANKADKLQGLEEQGAATRKLHDAAMANIATFMDKVKDCQQRQHQKRQEYQGAKALIDNAKTLEETPAPRYLELGQKKLALQAEIAVLAAGQNAPTVNKLQAEIDDLTAQIDRGHKAEADLATKQDALDRLKKLEAEQRDLGEVYEGLEATRQQCENFLAVKTRVITDKINSLFELARFKLFEVRVNGEVNDQVCESTYLGVPYDDLNNGARINLGLDIINALGRFYGEQCPIFIDNAESVTEIMATEGQQIRLYVSGKDKKLRVL